MRLASPVFGPEGRVPGRANAAGIPATLPPLNIISVAFSEVPDRRPAEMVFDFLGRSLTSTRVYEAATGHVTHRVVGDPTPRLAVSCPKARSWNHACASHVVAEVTPVMTLEEVQLAAAAATKAVSDLVVGLVLRGCPEHDQPAVAPAVLDQLLAARSAEDIAALVTEATSDESAAG